MEQLNRIELQGRVGSSHVIDVGGAKVAHVSLCTNHVFEMGAGAKSIETTWHNVTVWDDRMSGNLEDIRKGDCLNVVGRVKRLAYTGSDGVERYTYEVIASACVIVDG